MKRYATFITRLIWFFRILLTANLIILAYGLWTGDNTAEAVLIMCCAVAVFAWPDSADRKINQSIKNPYRDGN